MEIFKPEVAGDGVVGGRAEIHRNHAGVVPQRTEFVRLTASITTTSIVLYLLTSFCS